jgi:hypothetical protein
MKQRSVLEILLLMVMAFLINVMAYNRIVIIWFPFIVPFFAHYNNLIFPDTLIAFPVLLLII